VEKGGLPVPANHTDYMSTTGAYPPWRTAASSSDISSLVIFYRGELANRGWNERVALTRIDNGSAVLFFEGKTRRLKVNLKRDGDATSIQLIQTSESAAKAAGLLPQRGRAKVILSNPATSDAVITIQKLTYKVAAGTTPPHGPILDLLPGKYTFTLTLPGREPRTEKILVEVNETWELRVAPEGLVSVQVY